MKIKHTFWVFPLVVTLVCGLLLFTPLDNKVYDLFLRAIPKLTEDPSVLVITVDDAAINGAGIFPWTRDILADAIVFLREMGANTVAFDLSYLDNSSLKVDPRYIQEELPRYLDDGFRRINEGAEQALNGFASGALRPSDAPGVQEELRNYNQTIRDELGVSIEYVARDLDAYFADTLQFFGNSWLTLTMITSKDLLSGDSYNMNPAIQNWLEQNVAVQAIDASGDTLTPAAVGILPSIFKLLSRGRGAGFVNADPDSDGIRRRLHLLFTHNGYYYGQLALSALRESLGNPKIGVNNAEIVLKDAVVKGEKRDIVIPRARDGSVLLNWPQKSFNDYNTMSSWELIRYNRQEAGFAANLGNMRDAGFFTYWDGGADPLQKYEDANYIKELLYSGPDPEQGLDFETWLAYRADYLESAGAFLNGPYEDAILRDIGDDSGGEGEVADYVRELFSQCREQYADLCAIREQVSARVKDSFCVIGVAATSMTDESVITYQENYPNVGTYAVIANQILSGEFLDDGPRWVSLLLALSLSLGVALITSRLDVGKSVLAGLIAMLVTAAFFLAFFIAFKRYLGAVVPFASVTLTFLTLTGLNFFTTLREKSFLRSAFSRYLAPQVIEQIIADPSKLNLGGEKREMTAIFTDVQRFSSISEVLQDEYGDEGAKELVSLLNLYLTEMSDIVLANQGTIDKYEGDAIIAFFGAPIYTEEHAVQACRSAIQMKKREAALRDEVMNPSGHFYAPLSKLIAAKTIRPDRPLYTRLGINTGSMVVGNMGTPNKMDYTIMGNAVNLAARLEGVNKQYNTHGILISEYTREKIGGSFVLRGLDRVRVVGINTPLRLYELFDTAEDAPAPLVSACAAWEEALRAFEECKWQEAAALFGKLRAASPDDGVAALYLDRCAKYQATPPDENWDGVYNLTEK
jgi:adenylate cyclase